MQTRYGVGRIVVVAVAVFVMLLGSTGRATAQRRSVDRTQMFALANLAGGSRIGLSIEDVADNDAADEGAVVRDVRPGSPAASAGFAEGDIMVEFDGERVRSARHLTRLVQDTPAGRTVGTVVMRDGRRVELEVTPEPASFDMAAVVGRVGERLDNYTRVLPDAGRNFAHDFRTRLGPGAAGRQRARALAAARRLLRGRRRRAGQQRRRGVGGGGRWSAGR